MPVAVLTPEDDAALDAVADPVAFAEDVLGHELWSMQRAILSAIARPHARVAVKGCHASSKTFAAAEALLWFVQSGGIVITTAPTWTQVENLLWAEVHTAYDSARVRLGGRLLQTEYKLASGSYALGLSTNQGVRFQGWHGRRVLFIVDEGPGVEGDIWLAIEGAAAGGDVRILALGNPTIAAGPFYDAFGPKAQNWQRFTIDAFDTPNLRHNGQPLTPESLRLLGQADPEALYDNPLPYLVTRAWVYEKLLSWGEDSPLWQARIRAQFPVQAPGAVFPLAWLERAQHPVLDDGVVDVIAGLDVAGPGEDETALCIRSVTGQLLLRAEWTEADARGLVLDALRPWHASGRLRQVNVDAGGIGWYMLAHLRDHLPPRPGRPITVAGVNAGSAPIDGQRFVNRKAEMYWQTREQLEQRRVEGITDDDTLSQLSTLRYSHDSLGRIRVESKDDARKRGQRSPDRAEALILAYIPPAVSDFMGPLGPGGQRTNQVTANQRAANPYAGLTGGRRMMGLR